MGDYPLVMVGCPVRNRQWALPLYLKALTEMIYPVSRLEYCFVANDCTDATEQILGDFIARQGRGQVLIRNLGRKCTLRSERGYYSLRHLAWLRNQLLEAFLVSDAQYLFSVDSDILVTADGLQKLLNDNCDIVAALVCHGLIADRLTFNVLSRNQSGEYIFSSQHPTGIFTVDCTGAAYLITRKVISRGVNYNADLGSEDIGFCLQAQQKGFSIYCDSNVKFYHMEAPSPYPERIHTIDNNRQP